MNFYIQTIDHKDQRYETVGDWYQGQLWGEDGGDVSISENGGGDVRIISVSKLGDARYEALIAIHELIESVLCAHAGIAEESVTVFDEEFEAARLTKTNDGSHFYFRGELLPINTEPGDHLEAPYYMQHTTATYVERLLARKLGVEWSTYEKVLEEVGNDASSAST